MKEEVQRVSPDSWMGESKDKINKMPNIPVLLLNYFFRDLMGPIKFKFKQYCNPNSNSDSIVDYDEHALVCFILVYVHEGNEDRYYAKIGSESVKKHILDKGL